MQGICLRFYVHENRKHKHLPLYEWLLEEAKRLGIQGGSAFKAMAGYGRHGVLHEEHFFELAGGLAVEVAFVASAEECGKLLSVIEKEGISLFYAKSAVEYGVLGDGR
jgi:PII-like signaling protein